jgi:Ca2+-transporting ATPase
MTRQNLVEVAAAPSSAEPFGRPSTHGSHATRAGVSVIEAQRRLTQSGPNEIRREQATSPVMLLAGQFASPVIWLLLGATLVSLALGELLDALAIGVILLVNAVIGFLQEHRAERAVMALRSMTTP